jgi:hypothetical protein
MPKIVMHQKGCYPQDKVLADHRSTPFVARVHLTQVAANAAYRATTTF